MSRRFHILYIDHSIDDRARTRGALSGVADHYRLTEIDSRERIDSLALDDYDLVLCDVNIPGLPGLEILELLRAARPTVPVVVLTASGSETMAVHAFRRGVADYVMKEPGELERLPSVLSSVLKANHFDHIAGPEPDRDLPNGEEFPRRLIDAMPVGIQYLDSGLRVLYHNAVMRQWVGRSYVGETCCHAIWGCDEIYQDCQAARVVQEGRSLESIIEPPLADAQWAHFTCSAILC